MIIGATIHAEENPSEMIAPIMFNYKTIQLLLHQACYSTDTNKERCRSTINDLWATRKMKMEI